MPRKSSYTPTSTGRSDVGRISVEKKKYKTRRGPGSGALGSQQVLWYEQPDASLWEYILPHVKAIRQRQIRRRYELCVYQNFYCNFESYFSGNMYNPTGTAGWNQPFHRLSANVIKSCTDTATARIAKDTPRIFALPNTSESRVVEKAKNQTKFLDGGFTAARIYENAQEVFRDGALYGDGYFLLYKGKYEVKSEALKVDEVIIDPIIGMRNKPQEIHWQTAVPRRKLLADYRKVPGAEAAIESAKNSWRGDMSFMGVADQVQVTYTWRIASCEDAGDGRYAVCIDGFTLEAGIWDKDYLPIFRWQWTPPTYGPFGMGIAHELEGRQMAIASLLRDYMHSCHLFAVPRIWLEKNSGVSQHSLTNETGMVGYYVGNPPVTSTPSPAGAGFFEFIVWLISDSFQQVGLSQMTAQSEKPAGLNSGIAMRTYQDVETQRFAIVGQRWERFFVDIAHAFVDMAADIYGKTKKYTVNVPGRNFLERIDWKDIGLKRDQYELAAFPTNILPRTPEGQIQTASELINSGFMPKDVALSQMRIPNLNAWIDEQTASRDNINMCISRIRDKGKYVAPNGIADLDLCVSLAMSAWLRAEMDDTIPPERTEMLLRFLTEAQAKQESMKAAGATSAAPGVPGAPGAGASAGPGGGAPGATPVGQAPPPPPAPLAPRGAGAIQAAA